ncbi:MAG: hypothetical protein HQL90_02965 [Magnetococcales bacterium]|nr:hypothetical protein [Magnetococcales bacterium]
MAKVVRLFCGHCNAQCFYHPDRRASQQLESATNLLPFVDLRKKKDRRRRHERRLVEELPAGMIERRSGSWGRRCRDGYAWFEGCIEEAIEANWYVRMVDDAADSGLPATVLCPKCRRKIR